MAELRHAVLAYWRTSLIYFFDNVIIVLTTYTADMYVILYALLILGALCEIQIFAQILHRNKQINK